MNNTAQLEALREEVDFLLSEDTDRFEMVKEGLKQLEKRIKTEELNLVYRVKRLAPKSYSTFATS